MIDPDERLSHVDYRFTLANERTFLAWMRTALALLAAAVAVVQFAPDLGSATFRQIVAVVFGVLAAGVSAGGLVRWLGVDRAMREEERLGRGVLPFVVTIVLTAAGVAVGAVVLKDVL